LEFKVVKLEECGLEDSKFWTSLTDLWMSGGVDNDGVEVITGPATVMDRGIRGVEVSMTNDLFLFNVVFL